jgi:hypothetical protein
MTYFVWLQHTALSTWVVQSDSVWAYPTILTAHTVGLAILVGAAAMIDLRLLGVGAETDGVDNKKSPSHRPIEWPFVVSSSSSLSGCPQSS